MSSVPSWGVSQVRAGPSYSKIINFLIIRPRILTKSAYGRALFSGTMFECARLWPGVRPRAWSWRAAAKGLKRKDKFRIRPGELRVGEIARARASEPFLLFSRVWSLERLRAPTRAPPRVSKASPCPTRIRYALRARLRGSNRGAPSLSPFRAFKNAVFVRNLEHSSLYPARSRAPFSRRESRGEYERRAREEAGGSLSDRSRHTHTLTSRIEPDSPARHRYNH